MRLLRRAALCLIVGLAVTLLIAIAASLTSKARPADAVYIIPGRSHWTVQGTVVVKVAPGPFRTDLWLDPGPYSVSQRRGGGLPREDSKPPAWIRGIALDHAGERFAGWMARVAAYGWPRPVLYWIWDWRDEAVEGGIDMSKKVVVAAGPPPKVAEAERAVPWRIMWAGLAVNTLVFAGALWTLVTVVVGWRALRRGARGRCLKCGYDVRGIRVGTPCPECGGVTRDTSRCGVILAWVSRAMWVLVLGIASTMLLAFVAPVIANSLGPGEFRIGPDILRSNREDAGFYQLSRRTFSEVVQSTFPDWTARHAAGTPAPSWAYAMTSAGGGGALAQWKHVDTHATGWPFRAFAGAVYEPQDNAALRGRVLMRAPLPAGVVAPPAPPTPVPVRIGLVQFRATGATISIPWHPIPRGLALNILVHSAAWAVVWLVARAVRRRGRRSAAADDSTTEAPPPAVS